MRGVPASTRLATMTTELLRSHAAPASVAELAAATPAGRDRYVDLLRVGSLGVVVLGHWTMAAPVIDASGAVRVTNLLAAYPHLQPLTWLLQVMPVFFFVGGFSQATALASAQRRGGTYADFIAARAARLLRPAAAFVAVWCAIAVAAGLAGQDHGLVRTALRTVAQPLWFLGVYLAVVALAPAMWRLHRRLGRYAVAVPLGLFVVAAAVDALRFAAAVAQVAPINLLVVWLGVHQLGFFYADGSLLRGGRRTGALLAGAGLTGLVVLTTAGPYPVSMVGVPGDAVSNMSPPTLALAAHAVWLTGLVLLLRAPARRWLARAAVWRAVIAANAVAMTAFLWHLTAAFAAIGTVYALGWSMPAVGSGMWWLLRPVWLGVLVLLTAALVAMFRRFDAARPARPAGPPAVTAVAACGAALCAVGILGVSAVGFGGLVDGRTANLIVVPITAPGAIVVVAAGALLLRRRANARG
jgi:hypothetical protein